MPKTGMRPIRRAQLIQATLGVIDQAGLANATMAVIAKQAGTSTGIVSHYFGDKMGLLEATMRSVLHDLFQAMRDRRAALNDTSPRARLRAMIDANFDSSQISVPVMKTWLSFWSSSMHEPALQRLQRVNQRRLQSNLCGAFRDALPAGQARHAAAGLAALIDGLWLRGALSGGLPDTEHARALAYQYVEFQLAALPSQAAPFIAKELA